MNLHRARTSLVLAAIAGLAGSSLAATVTWDGSASSSWNTADNWDTGALPTDVAAFTNVGLSADEILTLDAAQTISALSFDTTTSFKIGETNAPPTLTLASVSRSGASSGTQTIQAPIALSGAAGTDSTWDINGSGFLNIAKPVSGSANIVKTGNGDLWFSVGPGTTYVRSGNTTVLAGAISLSGHGGLGSGTLTIGDGITSSAVYARWTQTYDFDAIGNSAAVIVKTNSLLDFETYHTSTGTRNESIGSLTVEAGSQVKVGKFLFYMGGSTGTSLTLKGGTITGTSGAIAPNSANVVVDPSATEMPVISARLGVRQQYSSGNVWTKFNVNNIASLPVDLKLTGVLFNAANNNDGFDKIGAGVMKVTGSSTFGGNSLTTGRTRVQVGTLLVDNTTGSGTGSSYVTVSGGATLGGTGTIGGLTSATNANVSLTGTSGSALATLAPGSVNETTGDHILGTLTVGSATQNNSVTFGNYTQLLAQLGNAGNGDKLAVVGNLNLNSAGNSDALALLTASGATLDGIYTLATFSGTLTGRFDTVTLNGGSLGNYTLEYRNSAGTPILDGSSIANGSIVLVVPEPATATLVIGLALGALSLRKRSA